MKNPVKICACAQIFVIVKFQGSLYEQTDSNGHGIQWLASKRFSVDIGTVMWNVCPEKINDKIGKQAAAS